MDGQRLDEDGVDGGGGDGIHLGDGGGLDGTVNQVVLGELALVKGDSTVITFHLRREHKVVVSAQKDGNLAWMGGGRGLREARPFGRGWEGEPGAMVQVFFDAGEFEPFSLEP